VEEALMEQPSLNRATGHFVSVTNPPPPQKTTTLIEEVKAKVSNARDVASPS